MRVKTYLGLIHIAENVPLNNFGAWVSRQAVQLSDIIFKESMQKGVNAAYSKKHSF